MLEVLLWLDRFDLDGKQITSRRLRSLVENNRMPLRKVVEVEYNGDDYDDEGESDREDKRNTILSIHHQDPQDDEPPRVEIHIETEADAQKAASYLASCFVPRLLVYEHYAAPPRNAIIAAPALINELNIQYCDFVRGDKDTLSEALNGSTFRRLSLGFSHTPAWQVDDNRLESLRRRGCNEFQVCPWIYELRDGAQKFHVTEEGVLRYCFTMDDDLAVPATRILRLAWANVAPAFFTKLVDMSKNSPLTCDAKLILEHLRFDVTSLYVGVTPSRGREYHRTWETYLQTVRYDIADHGNGTRLLIIFKSGHRTDEDWKVIVRHGQKDHKEFFEPTEDD